MGMTRGTPGVAEISRWVMRYALRRRMGLVTVVVTLLARTGVEIVQPWPMAVLVDRVLQHNPLPDGLEQVVQLLPGAPDSTTLLTWAVGATVVIFLVEWLLGLANAYAKVGFGQHLVYDVASDLLDHVQRLSLAFHTQQRSTGDAIRRVTRDSGSIAIIIQDACLPVLSALLSLGLMFSLMWQLDAALALIAVGVLPLLVLIFRHYGGRMADRSYVHEEAEARLYDVVERTLSAIPVVQAFGREQDSDQTFRDTTRVALRTELDVTNIELQFEILVGLSTAVGTAAILWVGAQHVFSGQLTLGTILVFISYLTSLYGPLESLMELSSRLQGATGSARRVVQVLQLTSDVRDSPSARPLPPARGAIRFDQVTFGYAPGHPVLNTVSLDIQPGQTVAFVGATGAGKSTLVSLVPRFFDPWNGRVLIDGHDLRDVQIRSLRSQIAVVLQDPFLFPLSIADNIAYGQPDASRAAIEHAARAASAHDFIQNLPDGYDTLVGERGATLSGGERQRLAIARALLKNAPILILDEPTSALDPHTEAQLLQALQRLTAGRTTLTIAHRLSTIRNADLIVVLDHGRIVETGTHLQLLRHGGHYSRFHALHEGKELASTAAHRSN